MRRKIELWINGERADLNEQSLVLFNYAYTDLENPTAVKNSYSQQVTLPGTANNASIFGHIARPDRQTGDGFNALSRTPFTIYADTGEILKSGYLKLDQVSVKRGLVQGYKVSLYGGLGSFLYALSYDSNGDKLTLADLSYLDGGPTELDFTITAANVQAAWNRVSGDIPEQYNSIWDVINFAPAYNGIPEGDFDANKGIAIASNLGLSTSETEGGKTYTPNGSNVLINLAEKHNEWDVKDLRCYLQRPVLSMRAFLVAIGKWATENGYTFDYSGVPEQQYLKLYKTLPMLPSLGSFKQGTGDLTFTYYSGYTTTTGETLDSYAKINGVAANMEVNATLNSCMLAFPCSDHSGNPGYLKTKFPRPQSLDKQGFHTIIFLQLLGYSGSTLVAASPVNALADDEIVDIYGTPERLAEAAGFTPVSDQGYAASIQQTNYLFLASNAALGYFDFTYIPRMEVSGGAFSTLRLAVHTYTLYGVYQFVRRGYGDPGYYLPFSKTGVYDTGMKPYWWPQSEYGNVSINTITATGAGWASPSAAASYRTSSQLRSGALIEKAKLLSSKHTPADYLLSLGVQFGWVFHYDEVSKKFTILTRNDYFNTGLGVIDLTDRVDTSREIVISPAYAGARIYEFSPEMAMGHFAEEYASIYGVNYGIQRVDTGYQFDGSPENLLAKSAFRAAATILESGPYWNYITDGGHRLPSVFLDKGNTYTMWAPDGTNKQFDIPCPSSSATIDYINDWGHDGYDYEFAWKLDLHDADGKAVDGEDILVYYSGYDRYDHFRLSDDTAAMLAINNGKPCWNLNVYSSYIRIANFHRYDTDTEWGVEASLDFGTPREVDLPSVNFMDDSSGYLRAWAAFIRDRYNRDTKVMKCRVHFKGLQVNQDLLRRFFYYQGSYWVLNKITNYSLTTWDPVECEFIQVQDMSNYTNGQIVN